MSQVPISRNHNYRFSDRKGCLFEVQIKIVFRVSFCSVRRNCTQSLSLYLINAYIGSFPHKAISGSEIYEVVLMYSFLKYCKLGFYV